MISRTVSSSIVASTRYHFTPATAIRSTNIFYHERRGIAIGASRALFSPTITTITLPALSPTMTHGTIAAWLRKPGEAVKAGDTLCEIDTDKASVGFEVQDDAVLALILQDAHGPELKCGSPIALTVEDAAAYEAFLKLDPGSYAVSATAAPAAAAAPSSSAAPSAPAGASATAKATTSGNQRFSPAARHMIESKQVDPSGIVGTARGGIISKADVILAINAGTAKAGTAESSTASTAHASVAAAAPATAPAVAGAGAAAAAAAAAPAAPVMIKLEDPTGGQPVNSRYTDIPNNNMRKIIAKRLTESKQTVPHFYTAIECEIDDLLTLRKILKKDLDVNVSVNDLVIKSAALALRDVPEANAKWNRGTRKIDHGQGVVDISVAVATPNGLITPIVTGADKRGLGNINAVVKDLAARARDGKLKPEEFQGGSFSVSNLGMFGITSFSAVINPPQACILAVGAGVPRVKPPKTLGGKPYVATTLMVQLSGDRRVVDEALAAQFLHVFQSYLNNPKTMML